MDPCEGEGCISLEAASYAPAFGAFLCHTCRENRTAAELDATRRANKAAAMKQKRGSGDGQAA